MNEFLIFFLFESEIERLFVMLHVFNAIKFNFDLISSISYSWYRLFDFFFDNIFDTFLIRVKQVSKLNLFVL